MARVEYKSTAVGVLLDRAGNARSGITITHTGTAPFAASTGATAYGGALTTNIDGEIPGWLDPGVYTMADPTTGKSWTFEVGGATTTTNEPTTNEKAALAGSSGAPSVSNKFVTDADPRNADARVPILTVGAVQAGVLAAGDFKVTQRGAGANQSVDVAGSTLNGGGALVRETATGRLRYVTQTGTVNLPVGVAHATLPRIDKVYVTTAGVLGYVEGTATGGATLDNMTGEPAVPANALFCGALLRPAATNNVTTANMRDRRPWAAGVFNSLSRVANAAAGNDYVFAVNTALTVIDTTNLRKRYECSGVPIRVTISGTLFLSASNANVGLSFLIDSAVVTGATTGVAEFFTQAGASAGATYLGFTYTSPPYTPAAGTHLIEPGYMSSSASNSVFARAAAPFTFTVEEVVRQKIDNA